MMEYLRVTQKTNMNETNCDVCTPFQTSLLSLTKRFWFKLEQHLYNRWVKMCWMLCIFVPDSKNPTVLETWYWWEEEGDFYWRQWAKAALEGFFCCERNSCPDCLGVGVRGARWVCKPCGLHWWEPHAHSSWKSTSHHGARLITECSIYLWAKNTCSDRVPLTFRPQRWFGLKLWCSSQLHRHILTFGLRRKCLK